MVTKESRLVDVISVYFGDHVLSVYARKGKTTKTGKVNLKSLVCSDMLEGQTATIPIGDKKVTVNLLQVGCWIHGIDITKHGVTRTSAIDPIRNAIVEYLKIHDPKAKWEVEKEEKAPRVSLEDMLGSC